MTDIDAFHKARMQLGMLFPDCMLLHRGISVSWRDGETAIGETRDLMIHLVQNINEGFMHAAIYVKELDAVATVFAQVLAEQIPQMLQKTEIVASNETLGELPRSNHDIQFTKTLYLLYDHLSSDKQLLADRIRATGLFPVFCDDEYLEKRLASGSLDVFICHDSADKADVARPLAHELIKRHLTVWLDEVSLSIGDSLIDSIERGLQDSKCGVIVVSSSFLENKGWTKREFKSLISRELSEERKIVLPLWHGVSRQEVAKYSIELADKFALSTDNDMSMLAKQIHQEVTKSRDGSELAKPQ